MLKMQKKIELEVSLIKEIRKFLYKMRPKKTRRKMGHRQELTRVMVKSIKIGKSFLSLLLKRNLLKRN